MNFSYAVCHKKGLRMSYLVLIAILFLILPQPAQAQAPVATTGAASGIGLSFATVNATVNANGAPTTVTFEYGPDTNYGGTFAADQSPVTGTTNTAVSVVIYELSPNTIYHFPPS